MTVSIRPLLAWSRAKLRPEDVAGFDGLAAQAVERIELSPAVVRDRPAALSLPGEFDRPFGYYGSKEAMAVSLAGGRNREDGATIAYALRDAIVAHGAVYAGTASQLVRRDGPRVFLWGRPEQRDAGVLIPSKGTEWYFGDWLFQAPLRCLLAERMGLPAIAFDRKPWLHEPGYNELLDVGAEPVRYARFRTLWLIDDRGINHGRTERFRELRRRLRAKVTNPGGPERVFLPRGGMGKGTNRTILNAPAVEEQLAALGFEMTNPPEHETPLSLARKLVSARIVVTVEGSMQLHALLAMPEGGVIIALEPPDRFMVPAKEMADMAGLRYGFMVGTPGQDGFTVDLERLRQTIALAEDALRDG